MGNRLLLHTCCASCLVYVHHKLESEYRITCYFCNPNIHPAKEYESRKTELERVAGMKHWDVVYADDDIKEWFGFIRGHEKDPEKGDRCSLCFYMRLRKAFEYAALKGYDAVTSTLSISPYKVTDQINAEGEKLSREFGIRFLPESFKKNNGYHIGRKMGMELGIKRQDYCGCVYSKLDKLLRQRKRV